MSIRQNGEKLMNKAVVLLIVGFVFILLGIALLVTGAVSQTIAYGGVVVGICFLALGAQEKSNEGDGTDKK